MAVQRTDTATAVMTVGSTEIVGVSRDTMLGLSRRGGGGFISYARPLRIDVREHGETRTIDVPDLELRTILVLLSLAAAIGLTTRRRRS